MQGMARVAWLSSTLLQLRPSVLQHASSSPVATRDVGRTREHQAWPISSLASVKTDGDPNGRRASRISSRVFCADGTRPFDLSSTTGLHKDASLRYQGATAASPDDASARGRSLPPFGSFRWTRAPEASRPPRRIPKKPDGGGKVPGSRERGRGRRHDDSECLLAKPPNAGAVPRHEASPCIQNAHAVRPVCVWCGGGGASTSAR